MEEKTYNLFLDDMRFPYDVFLYTGNPIYSKEEWVIVRSYDEFTLYISEHGLPNIISFDHDLADEHYAYYDTEVTSEIDYNRFTEKTGYECAKWVVDYCIDRDYIPCPQYLAHTMNTVGGENIIGLFKNYMKHINE